MPRYCWAWLLRLNIPTLRVLQISTAVFEANKGYLVKPYLERGKGGGVSIMTHATYIYINDLQCLKDNNQINTQISV